MPIFRARFKGTCAKCGGHVDPGTLVSWSRRARGIIYHAACVTPGAPDSPQPNPQPFPPPGAAPEAPPAPLPAPSPTPSSDTAAIRELVDQIVDQKIAEHITRSVVVSTGNGAAPVQVNNAHAMLVYLLHLILHGHHVYLYGPPGSGKSTGAIMAAKALKRAFGYVSLNPQTPESKLFGHPTASGGYVETVFIKMYEEGGVFIIDELDNAHPALLNTLNSALESDEEGIGRLALPHRIVTRHPDFICVATGNTNGRGADKLFPERRALDSAFLERFAFIRWEYDLALEEALTLAQYKHGAAWLAWVRQVRAYTKEHSIRLWASPRASIKGAALLRTSDWPAMDIAHAVLFKGLDADTCKSILSACPLNGVRA